MVPMVTKGLSVKPHKLYKGQLQNRSCGDSHNFCGCSMLKGETLLFLVDIKGYLEVTRLHIVRTLLTQEILSGSHTTQRSSYAGWHQLGAAVAPFVQLVPDVI